MKKGISAILAGSMAVSMFASLASAATTTMTTQQRYEMLEEAGIFTGFEDGTARLNERMTRAQFARVAVLLLELDLTAPPATATFRDVPKGHWAFEEVEAAVDAGIISGVGNGLFNPNANVTIQEMARVLVDALDIDTETNATVEGTVAAWAVPYVAAAVKAGLIPATTNYTAPATRAQLVDASAVAYDVLMGAGIASVTATETGTVTVVFEEEIDAAAAADFVVTQSIGGAAATTVTPTTVTLGADKKTVTITVPAVAGTNADQKVVLSVSYKGQTAVAAKEFTVAGSLQTSGVKVLNAKQIQVTFNRDVDAASATAAANFTITSGATGTSIPAAGYTIAALDARNVVITFTTALTNNTPYSVTVRGVSQSGAADIVAPIFSTTVTVADATPPAVSSISAVTGTTTATTATVTFSEPVAQAVFRVNGTAVGAAADATGTVWTLSGLSLSTTGTHTLEVIRLTDFAGNTTAVSQTFTATQDAVAPTVTVTAQGDNKVKLTFSEGVTGVAANTSVRIIGEDLITNVNISNLVAVDAMNYIATIDPTYTLYASGVTTRTLNVVVTNAIGDVYGNKIATQTKQVALAKDVTAPTVQNITFTRNAAGNVDAVVINVSEDVVSFANLGTIRVLNANGEEVTNLLNVGAAAVSGTTVKIPLNTPAALTGSYTFYLPAGVAKEASAGGASTAATTQIVNFGTGAAAAATFTLDPNAAGVVTSSNNVNNMITVDYKTAMKGGAVAGSATDANNYTLNGAPLPAGTLIYFQAGSNQTIAVIDLPNSNAVARTETAAVLRIANVQTTAGSTITPFVTTTTVVDNTAPVLTSARVLSANTIELTYSENVALADVNLGDEIGVSKDGAAVAATDNQIVGQAVSGFANRILITVTNGAFASGTITVTTKTSGGVTDVANTALVATATANGQAAGTTVTATR